MVRVAENNKSCRLLSNTFLSAVDVLSSVHSFGGNEKLLVDTVLVWVSEVDTSKRGTTSRIVDDLLNQTSKVAIALRIIEGSEASRTFSVVDERLEDTTSTLSLTSDYTSHWRLVIERG